MKSFFRVEHAENKHGPWRTIEGKVDPVFPKLTVGKCRALPMPDDDTYRKDGLRWVATTDKLETLLHWFDIKDIEELSELGYVVAEYLFEDDSAFFRRLSEFETVIVLEKATSYKVIPLDKLRKETKWKQ